MKTLIRCKNERLPNLEKWNMIKNNHEVFDHVDHPDYSTEGDQCANISHFR